MTKAASALLLIVMAAAACSSDTPESSGATALAPVASEACASGAVAGREVSVSVGGESRSALLHQPDSSAARMPPPLVLAFHGYGSSPIGMETGSGLSTKADEAGFVVVYPEGTGFTPGWDLLGTEDTEFVSGLLDGLEGELCFDLRRVYATGMSMGGGMADAVGCRLADRVTAIAPVAGVYAPKAVEACAPARPVPVIAFHGVLDDVVPYEGGPLPGEHHEVIGVDSWAAAWAERNGCAGEPRPQPRPIETVEPIFWMDCTAPVELYPVTNRGHAWPGSPLDASSETANDLVAADLIWEFFSRQVLPDR